VGGREGVWVGGWEGRREGEREPWGRAPPAKTLFLIKYLKNAYFFIFS